MGRRVQDRAVAGLQGGDRRPGRHHGHLAELVVCPARPVSARPPGQDVVTQDQPVVVPHPHDGAVGKVTRCAPVGPTGPGGCEAVVVEAGVDAGGVGPVGRVR